MKLMYFSIKYRSEADVFFNKISLYSDILLKNTSASFILLIKLFGKSEENGF